MPDETLFALDSMLENVVAASIAAWSDQEPDPVFITPVISVEAR
ncbi:hypothetical protein [Demequina litorisediminis]|nr:hypothetical protein [Demequina litorisediminis]